MNEDKLHIVLLVVFSWVLLAIALTSCEKALAYDNTPHLVDVYLGTYNGSGREVRIYVEGDHQTACDYRRVGNEPFPEFLRCRMSGNLYDVMAFAVDEQGTMMESIPVLRCRVVGSGRVYLGAR